MIPITDVAFDAEIEESVLTVLRSGSISQGPVVARLEREFAAMLGAGHAVAVNNGTTALVATLEALGVGPGDEVVVPAFTFVATLNAVLRVGATARLVDITEEDFAIDPDRALQAVTPRTRAVIAVHLFGQTGPMDRLAALTSRLGLHLIEDAAQAHGARHGGAAAGTIGTGTFSFYATKNLVAGEGGMVTTADAGLAERLRVLRNQGMRVRYDYEVVGNNYRMTDLAAAVLVPQLARYPDRVGRRRANAAHLTEHLSGLAGVRLPQVVAGREHVWHQYTVLVGDGSQRDAAVARLRDLGVGCGVYYPRPLGDYPLYRDHPAVRTEPTPVADQVAARCLSLPVHDRLSAEELRSVARIARAVFSEAPDRPARGVVPTVGARASTTGPV